MAVQLPYTLQTWVGMVMNNGAPQSRRFPCEVKNSNVDETTLLINDILGTDRKSLSKHLPEVHSFKDMQDYKPSDAVVQKAVEYVQRCRTCNALSMGTHLSHRFYKFAANLTACSSDVSKGDLKGFIKTRTRFDLEQAAAVVVSAFIKYGQTDAAIRLVKELGTVLATSCMWIDPSLPLPMSPTFAAPDLLAIRLQQGAAAKGQDIPLAKNYRDLLPLLMRVRRCKPDNRCLHLPEWLFDEAGISAPTHFKKFFYDKRSGPQAPRPGFHPTSPMRSDSIILSKKFFNHIQRRIIRLFSFWKPDHRLRRRIKKIEDKVLFSSSWVEDRVFETDDVALLCHYFFYFQRRLQRKVVSDMNWTGFLAKGQGSKLYQNNTSIESTFEKVLLDIVESNDEGIIVAMDTERTLDLIDDTCLLMKEYVDIYGKGKKESLTYAPGQRGGRGRGPVDEYNLLCDVLAQLRRRARDEGIVDVPGPTHKFLAKDILQYNNTWGDDAFADGKKPGWEDWIKKRGLVEDEGWALMEAVSKESALPLR